MIQVVNLSKSYGDQTLFSQISFSMVAGERLGLVGRNGSGKSTLFKIILGEEQGDQGQVVFPRGYRIGHLEQHLNFKEGSVLKEACLGLPEDERDQEYRAEIILGGLGFSEDDMHKSPDRFSGGFQIRINLAKVLLSEPNLLLLDEPTNYLDIVSARWLTRFLRRWKNEIVIISHDRDFMDSVTTHEVGNLKTRSVFYDKVGTVIRRPVDQFHYIKTANVPPEAQRYAWWRMGDGREDLVIRMQSELGC